MKRKLDKASVHSGRANSKGVAYNPNHNTLEQSRVNQPHIDQTRIRLNQYLQYMGDGSTICHKGGGGGYDSRKHELERYRQLYGEGLEARNQRYRVSDPKLADYIRSKLSSVVDAETVEADIARVEKALKRAKANLKQRYDERDELDPTDPVDCVAIQSLKRSIDNLSVKIVEYQQDWAELNNKLVAVKQNQLTKDTVLKVLTHFSLSFAKMTPADQQVLLRSLVEEIQIFPEVTEDGRIIKSIKLCVPVVYENEKTPKISWDKLTPVESIVCLVKEC